MINMRLSGRQFWIVAIVVFELLALSFFVLHAPPIDEASRQQEALRRTSSQNIRQCLSSRNRDARFVDPRDACVTPRQRHEALRDLVYEAKILLEALHIEYWIDSGTLLGQHRMGDVLPWDLSADVAIFREGYETLKVTSTMLTEGYELNVFNSEIHTTHDRSDELPVRLVETRFGFYLDVVVFYESLDASGQLTMLGPPPSEHWNRCVKCNSTVGATNVRGGGPSIVKHLIVPCGWILPTQRCYIHKFEVSCPAQAKAYLEHLYGDDFMEPSVWS